jgi:hypothetical protein
MEFIGSVRFGLVWFGVVWFGLVWFVLVSWLIGWLVCWLVGYASNLSVEGSAIPLHFQKIPCLKLRLEAYFYTEVLHGFLSCNQMRA